MSNKIFKLFFFLGFFISNIILSQTNRFIYEVDFKLDSLQREPYTETFVLDINPKDVKFYNYNLLETDSLNKRFNDDSVLTLPTGLFTIVKHQLNKNEFTNFAFVGMDYYQFNSVDKIVWKLSNETKMYENYKLQKAEAIFGKRKWTAWFCKEIPINEGPYKFRGLPGLIFIVEDSAKNYKFTLKKTSS